MIHTAASRPQIIFEELGTKNVAPLGGDHLARENADNQLDAGSGLHSRDDFADLEELGSVFCEVILGPYKDDVAIPLPLQGGARNHNALWLFAEQDVPRSEGIRPQSSVRVVERAANLHGACLRIHFRA